jgi:beta-mannosidase
VSSRFGARTLEVRRNPYLPSKPRANPGKPSWLSDLGLLYGKRGETLWGRGDMGAEEPLIEGEAMVNSDESFRFLFVVNGRPLYIKGMAWLTSDDLLTLTAQRETWMIRAARYAGVNLFRLNGGNDLFETEQFYNLCDENGILVWQELPLTWPSKLQIPLGTWREQLKQSVLRIRQHPSLTIYVGGNEYMPYVQALAPYLGIAREVFAAYDDRPFRMSSPGGGTYHAYGESTRGFNDLWGGDPNGYVSLYDEAVNFVSEWSYWAYANMSLLERITPKQELASGPVGYDVKKFLEAHPTLRDHADVDEVDLVAPLVHNKSSWYGDLAKTSLEDFVEYSQMDQAHVYGYVLEHWRSQFPYKGGETLWTYNSHAPVSTWDLMDWFGQPKIAYYAIKRAHEPVHVMANTQSFTWGPGDTFHASVYAVNDSCEELPDVRITARLLDRNMSPVLRNQWAVRVPAGGSRSEPQELTWKIPERTPESYFFLLLSLMDGGRPLSRQAYWVRVAALPSAPEARRKQLETAEPLTQTGPWLKTQLESLPTALGAEIVQADAAGPELQATVVVRNTGGKPAYPVRLGVWPDVYSAVWSDNYFWLDPGERVEVQARIRLDMRGIDPVSRPKVATPADLTVVVSAWNAPQQKLSVGGAGVDTKNSTPPRKGR